GALTDTLSARLAAAVDRRGDWQESFTRDASHGARDFANLRLTFDWRPSELLDAVFGISGWRDRSDSPVGQYVLYNPQIPALASPQLNNYPLAPRKDIRAADWSPGTDWDRDNSFVQASARVDYA